MKHTDTARAMAGAVGLTPEFFSGAARVTVWGRRQVTVEQHRGLLGYSTGVVEVAGGKTRIRILGSGLLLQTMDRDTLVITGNITAVEYE